MPNDGSGLRHTAAAAAMAVSLLGAAACEKIPEEAVTLSVTVGQDIEQVHRSHRALAERYFARMKRDIETFIDEKYRPFLTERTLNASVNGTTVLEAIVAEARKPGGGRVLSRMSRTVERITARIASYRSELMEPVEAQERAVLRAIDDSYTRIQNAHAVVTGHLASIRKVQQAQDELLGAAGLKDVREKIIDRTAAVSDRIAEITLRARRGEQQIDEAAKTLCEIVADARKAVAGEGFDADAAKKACQERVR